MHYATQLYGLAPVIDEHTKLIILGSFPGQRSLSEQQYYAHPRNQFWALLSKLFDLDLHALAYTERLQNVLKHGLGIWDVYATCQRTGSLDSAITQAVINPLHLLKEQAPLLQAVAHNGGLSWQNASYIKNLGIETYRLPSSSPANARWSFEEKLEAWRTVLERHLPLKDSAKISLI